MMKLPDLTIQYGKAEKISFMWNLRRFLYVGGASLDARWGMKKIESGEVGKPLLERLELVEAIAEQFETDLVSGGSKRSIQSSLSTIKHFYQFADNHQLPMMLEQVEKTYLEWAEYLFTESHKKSPRINKTTTYGYAALMSAILGKILEIPVEVRLIQRTRLPCPKTGKTAISKAAEKQNLENTFKFGNFLTALVEGLTVDAIYGEFPIRIPVKAGLVQNDEIVLPWSLYEVVNKRLFKYPDQWSRRESSNYNEAQRKRNTMDSIGGTERWKVVNQRIRAEFFIFIAQTGMNRSTAADVKRARYHYRSLGDRWEVRAYKSRRGGTVLFYIYKSYKPFLQNHLKFINHFFPDSDLLFPIFSSHGVETSPISSGYSAFKNLCRRYDIPWIPPKTLRNTRINWLLRRSGDEDLTAEMAQHTKEVLREKYERPSQQRAMVQITRFWNKYDPIKQGELKGSVIGSQCNGKPEPVESKPALVVDPDCSTPSGCLWCRHHRDLDTSDYVWSLISMRYLKSIESSALVTYDDVPIPSGLAVDRLNDKIKWYRTSSKKRAKWVSEGELRIEEAHYHPSWESLIELLGY